MTISLAPYRVYMGEKPVSSIKQNATITAIENTLNSFPADQLVGYPGDPSLFLDGSGHWSSLSARGFPTSYVKTTTTDVVNTAIETDLFGGAFSTLPVEFSATGAYKIWAGGDLLHNVTASRPGLAFYVFNIRAFAVNSATSGADLLSANATRRAWYLEAVCGRYSTLYTLGGVLSISGPSNSTIGTGGLMCQFGPSTTLTAQRMMTVPFVTWNSITPSSGWIQFRVQHTSASPNLSMRCHWARVEVLR